MWMVQTTRNTAAMVKNSQIHVINSWKACAWFFLSFEKISPNLYVEADSNNKADLMNHGKVAWTLSQRQFRASSIIGWKFPLNCDEIDKQIFRSKWKPMNVHRTKWVDRECIAWFVAFVSYSQLKSLTHIACNAQIGLERIIYSSWQMQMISSSVTALIDSNVKAFGVCVFASSQQAI